MNRDLWTWLTMFLWLISVSSCLSCEAYKSWKYFPIAVNLCLCATFLLPMLIHTKNANKSAKIEEDRLSVEDAMNNVIAKMRELKAERREDE